MGPFRYLSHLALTSALLGLAESKLSCTPESFSKYLSSAGQENATVLQAFHIAKGDTFEVPASDIAYPQSPTELPELCVVQINVTSSATSAYTFGLFMPTEWNDRFL